MLARMVIVCVIMMVSFGRPGAAQGWEFRGNREGISCYSKTRDGSGFHQFKGTCVINAKFETVTAVLRDVPSYTQWMYNCREIKVLRTVSDHNRIVYYVNSSPWPVADRDVVVRTCVSTDEKTARGVISIESFNHPHPPVGGRVRMPLLKALFILDYVDRERTKVTFDISADPGGSIAPALVNAATRDHPYHTLKGLGRMAGQIKYVEMGSAARERDFAEKLRQVKGS